VQLLDTRRYIPALPLDYGMLGAVKPSKSHSVRAAGSRIRSFWSGACGSLVVGRPRLGRPSARQNVPAGRWWLAPFDPAGDSANHCTALNRGLRLKSRRLALPTIGPIRCGLIRIRSLTIRLPRIVPLRRAGTRISSVTITRRADGDWWAACTLERRLRPPRRPNGRAEDAIVAQAGGPKTAGDDRGRPEPAGARQFDHLQPTQVEHFSLPATPYSQLAINALTAPEGTHQLAEAGAADGMARFRRAIGRLHHYLTLGLS
jgi:hypothetical protein